MAGLVTGHSGGRRFSARDRQSQATTWTTISFILESAVFLAMGYQLPELLDGAQDETSPAEMTALVLLVLGLLVVLRFFGLAWPAFASRSGGRRGWNDLRRTRLEAFEERLDAMEPATSRQEDRIALARRRLARGKADVEFEEREPITARGSLVLAWAGMRGVVTVAAVQTIPEGTPHRSTVVLAAFFVALVTLVLFGLALPPLIARMRFRSESPEDQRDAFAALLRQVGEEAIDTLGPLEEQTVDGEPVDPQLASRLKDDFLPRLIAGVDRSRAPHHADAIEKAVIVQRRYVDAMRDALGAERSIGAYSSDTYRRVESLLDGFEQRLGRG